VVQPAIGCSKEVWSRAIWSSLLGSGAGGFVKVLLYVYAGDLGKETLHMGQLISNFSRHVVSEMEITHKLFLFQFAKGRTCMITSFMQGMVQTSGMGWV
jgi:hypothetical protein